jgi:hypothetical protein
MYVAYIYTVYQGCVMACLDYYYSLDYPGYIRKNVFIYAVVTVTTAYIATANRHRMTYLGGSSG